MTAPTWVEVPAGSAYPLQHLPYGVFRVAGEAPRCGVRIGDHVLDLSRVSVPPRRRLRPRLAQRLHGTRPRRLVGRARQGDGAADRALVPGLRPAAPGAHRRRHLVAALGGRRLRRLLLLRAPRAERRRDLPARLPRPAPNWKHLPIGYHGRAGTVVVSGTPSCGPAGSASHLTPNALTTARAGGSTSRPRSGSSSASPPPRGRGSAPGPSPTTCSGSSCSTTGRPATSRRGSTCRSARSSASPSPRRCRPGSRRWRRWPMPAWRPLRRIPRPLAYLTDPDPWALDLAIEVELDGEVVSRPAVRRDVLDPWPTARAPDRQRRLAAYGRPVRVGHRERPRTRPARLFPRAVWGGREPFVLAGGRAATFLEDGDTVILRASANGADGSRISLGEVAGTIRPAQPPERQPPPSPGKPPRRMNHSAILALSGDEVPSTSRADARTHGSPARARSIPFSRGCAGTGGSARRGASPRPGHRAATTPSPPPAGTPAGFMQRFRDPDTFQTRHHEIRTHLTIVPPAADTAREPPTAQLGQAASAAPHGEASLRDLLDRWATQTRTAPPRPARPPGRTSPHARAGALSAFRAFAARGAIPPAPGGACPRSFPGSPPRST